MYWRSFLAFLLFLSALQSCEKPPGEGGTSTLIGRVYAIDTNQDGEYQGEYWKSDYRVYVIYGDSPIFDDLTRTHFDGTYQFKYLYPGDYTLFCYSKCDTCDSGEDVVMEKVTIDGRGQTIEVPTITIID
ncbi:MAG: hypothetical protein AAF502_08170 [Bacteroidota bacterium]